MLLWAYSEGLCISCLITVVHRQWQPPCVRLELWSSDLVWMCCVWSIGREFFYTRYLKDTQTVGHSINISAFIRLAVHVCMHPTYHMVGPNSIYTQYICPILCWNLQIYGVYIRFWPTLNICKVCTIWVCMVACRIWGQTNLLPIFVTCVGMNQSIGARFVILLLALPCMVHHGYHGWFKVP